MKFVQRFKAFLENHVNLNQSRIDQLDDRVAAVTAFLKSVDHEIGDRFVQTIPQGSYAQRTIIKPVGDDDEFDADVLLELEEVDGWDADDYVPQLYEAFQLSGTYKAMITSNTRCVTVDYANEFHVDVVPFLRRHDDQYITNCKEDVFELTNPEGFNEWLEGQDRIAKGNLVRVIRLVKFMRDFHDDVDVKSVILTILLGQRVSEFLLADDPNHYEDLPTTLKNIFVALDEYLTENPTMPLIVDPSCPTEDFNHRWDDDDYDDFREWVAHYASKIEDAFEEPGRNASLALWQEVFGDDFGSVDEAKASNKQVEHSGKARETEQFLERDLHIPIQVNPAYRFRIGGTVLPRDGFRTYKLSRQGNKVGKRRMIRFTVTKSNIPYPLDLYWKVRNFGEEAIAANSIRGQIERDGGKRTREESTSYRGKHYVECYAVKNGVCVAMDRQMVIVT